MKKFLYDIVDFINYVLPTDLYRESDGSFYPSGFVSIVVVGFVMYLSIKLYFDICDKLVKR